MAAVNGADNFKDMDIRTVQPDTLEDLEKVTINVNQPVEERMEEFIRQIKNPYFFRCGKLIVQVEYSDTDKTINDCLMEYAESQGSEFFVP